MIFVLISQLFAHLKMLLDISVSLLPPFNHVYKSTIRKLSAEITK